ncbi:MAG: zinc ribbon domain-containing protein [Firmicutes bacterium]|jgi:putative FmdB family regulatory protein|nr:zinc ribbon domain-containing protein [Bacillota bacterium]HXL05185.1 zinc ribbon domain-containing protein [Bacillota bacterium]
MPIFEFKCKKCGAKFEELLRSSDTSNVTCPNCGTDEIKRLLSTFAYSGGSGIKTSAASSGGCGSCSGGSCSTCH